MEEVIKSGRLKMYLDAFPKKIQKNMVNLSRLNLQIWESMLLLRVT